jgi:hypothetical protein
MASSVPQEILCLIAVHLTRLDKRLSPYALVNKSWQAAFEKQIYSSMVVRSPSDVTTVEAYWPYLETLHLKNQVCEYGPFDGVHPCACNPLIERYLNDLYTSLGRAAQKMPRLKSVVLTFRSLDHELELSIKNEHWNLTLCVMDNYQPSAEFLKAWKVPGGSLQPCINKYWQQATYPSWPPSCLTKPWMTARMCLCDDPCLPL